jgi:hypothetical protein
VPPFVVFDFLFTVGHLVFNGGIDAHVLGHSMTHYFRNQRVREIPALAAIGCAVDLPDQCNHLLVIAGQDVHHVHLRSGGTGIAHELDSS